MFVQEAIILAGGLGTRLKEVVGDMPKPMAPVNGRPFLEYILDYLDHFEIEHVILSVGYKHELIIDHFGKKYKSVDIEYSVEESPLGTGGAIKKAFGYTFGKKAMVFNGDTMFRMNLLRLFDFHVIKSSDFTIVLRQVDDVSRYGAVERDDDYRIIRFNEKGEKSGKGMINGGIYLINKKFFEKIEFPEKFSIEKDCFEKMVHTFPFYGTICKQYFIDIGIPEDYQKAQDEFKEFEY
jgi:D-glycero-alpha-D-manno-heptose 1-phosphate guanylyltransferase